MRSRGSLGQGCQMSRLKPSNKSIADLFGSLSLGTIIQRKSLGKNLVISSSEFQIDSRHRKKGLANLESTMFTLIGK